MDVRVETGEKNTARIIVDITAAEFEEGILYAYKKNKNRFNIPGFRKGHAKKEVIERLYGPQVFFEEAVDHILDTTYSEAAEKSGLDIVSTPEISLSELKAHEGFTYTAAVATRPPVELGEYKGLKLKKADSSVSDGDVEKELLRVQDQNARIVTIDDPERKLKEGDTAVIKFDGSVDGKAFEGGSGDDYPLVLGSHSFIDNFEEQIVGHVKGDEIDVNVTFPVPYQEKSLEGKPALFKVVIKEIREKQLPDLDDEFAEEVSEFETLEEYRASIRADLKNKAERAAAQINEENAVQLAVDNAKVDIPAAMVETSINNMINDYSRRLKQQGVTFEQYLGYMGLTVDAFKEEQRPVMTANIKRMLVLNAIVEAEGIEASEEAVQDRIEQMAKGYGMEADVLKDLIPENEMKNLKDDIAVKEAIDFIVAEAELTDAPVESDGAAAGEAKEEV